MGNTKKKFEAVAIFSTPDGVRQLLKHIPKKEISMIVGAEIRPQFIEELKSIASNISVPYITQPKQQSKTFTEFLENFDKFRCKSIFSHCYSMLIPKSVLEKVGHLAANIHYALLPLNRGPNPVQWALIKGESETGNSAFNEEEFDAGEIIYNNQYQSSMTRGAH